MRCPSTYQFAIVLGLFTATAWCDEGQTQKPASKPDAGAQSRIVSTVEVKETSRHSERETEEIAFAATRVLKHIGQARAAIGKKKPDDAKRHVEQALKLTGMITSLQPCFLEKTEIKVGDQVYCDEDQVAPNYVLLFAQLEHHDIVTQVVEEKRRQHRKHTKGNQAQSANEPAEVVVVHEDFRFTTAKFDLALATQKLQQAAKALEDNNAELADQSLISLQVNGVVFELVELDLPLKDAVEQLRSAESQIKQGQIEKARTALQHANEKLAIYAKQGGSTTKDEVTAVQSAIEKVSSELNRAAATEAELKKLATAVSDCWRKVNSWFQQRITPKK